MNRDQVTHAIDSLFAVESEAYQSAIEILKRRAEQSNTYAVENALLEAAMEIEALARKVTE